MGDLAGCQKPKELGYSYEVWTQRLLAQHVRKHALVEGHECLSRMSSSSVSRVLAEHDLQPHKVRYYLERRDPDFDAKRSRIELYLLEVNANPVPFRWRHGLG
ncbi:hypothetical protein D1872_270940 [compost metagenome]